MIATGGPTRYSAKRTPLANRRCSMSNKRKSFMFADLAKGIAERD